jgi:hypothetical protein
MKTKITIRPATARLLSKVGSTLLIGFIAFEPATPACAQTGAYGWNSTPRRQAAKPQSDSTADHADNANGKWILSDLCAFAPLR